MTGFGNKNSKVSKLFANDVHIRGKTNNKPLILQNGKITPTSSITITDLTLEDITVNNDITLGGNLLITSSTSTVATNTLPEPATKFILIDNNSTVNTITTSASTNGAILILGVDTGITATITEADNINLSQGRVILTGDRTITLLSDGTDWREIHKSNPRTLTIRDFSYANLPSTSNDYVFTSLGGTGYPNTWVMRTTGTIIYGELMTDNDGGDPTAMTGDFVVKIWKNGTLQETFNIGAGDITAISKPAGTSATTDPSYSANFTPSSPIELAVDDYIHITVNMAGTSLSTGPEMNIFIHVLFD